jgi:hypothetical protein
MSAFEARVDLLVKQGMGSFVASHHILVMTTS